MSHGHALDMHDPRFNVRQLVKELLLLEDHLSTPERQCKECIVKHALKSEAWVDEALTLGPDSGLRALLVRLAGTLKPITAGAMNGDFYRVQQAVRTLRRGLQSRLV
jgi:hypothetical protein